MLNYSAALVSDEHTQVNSQAIFVVKLNNSVIN